MCFPVMMVVPLFVLCLGIWQCAVPCVNIFIYAYILTFKTSLDQKNINVQDLNLRNIQDFKVCKTDAQVGQSLRFIHEYCIPLVKTFQLCVLPENFGNPEKLSLANSKNIVSIVNTMKTKAASNSHFNHRNTILLGRTQDNIGVKRMNTGSLHLSPVAISYTDLQGKPLPTHPANTTMLNSYLGLFTHSRHE